jgi:trehalose-phosphatase
MQILNTGLDLEAFFDELKTSPQSALLLDYDGTLAPFRAQRDRAFPYPGVRERLQALGEHMSTRAIIVSGRQIKDVLELLQLERSPEIWGCHGAERLNADGTRYEATLPRTTADSLAAAFEWAQQQGLEPRCERKPTSLAFHWRDLPKSQAEAIRTQVEGRWLQQAESQGLMLTPFDGGLELRVREFDKGHVVEEVLTEMDGAGPIAYLGDDQTDEDAFAALAGRGLNVLVRKELRPTKADLWLIPPDELLDFLDRWLACFH